MVEDIKHAAGELAKIPAELLGRYDLILNTLDPDGNPSDTSGKFERGLNSVSKTVDSLTSGIGDGYDALMERVEDVITKVFNKNDLETTTDKIENTSVILKNDVGAEGINVSGNISTETGELLQKSLVKLGHLEKTIDGKDTIDGFFGKNSVAAYNKFLESKGLTKLDNAEQISGQHVSAVVDELLVKDHFSADPNLLQGYAHMLAETNNTDLHKSAEELSPQTVAFDPKHEQTMEISAALQM